MKTPTPPFQAFRRLLDRYHRRMRRSRPGSILILVIALLVLMALIGTAFITTARTDRYSAAQNGYNTQADLLIEGVKHMVAGLITSGVTPNGQFRPNLPAYNTYEHPQTSLYLADRYPTFVTGVGPVWKTVSVSPLGSLAQPGLYDSPRPADSNNLYSASPTTAVRTDLAPTYVAVSDGNTTRNYPAMKLMDVSGQPVVLAADTDGDGIADALLFRLPVGQVNGVTYFAAVRVVDNAAAVNLALAMKPNTENGNGVTSDIYPTNLGLMGMLLGSNEYANLNAIRFANTAPGLVPVGDSTSNPAAAGATRNEFRFASDYEAVWTQLGSRLNNPGWNTSSVRYKGLSTSDAVTLAYRFTLANQNATLSQLEQALPVSLASAGVNRAPYLPSDTTNWYNNIFNYYNLASSPPTANAMPLRAVLAGRNGVSSFAPGVYADRGFWANGTAYNFGERVTLPGATTADNRSYVCIRPNNNVAPNADFASAFWAAMPWTGHPTKVNVKTAEFGAMWASTLR